MLYPKIPNTETERLETLYRLNVLETETEERFDRITRIARKLFVVPIALVSLIDAKRQWFKSRSIFNQAVIFLQILLNLSYR